MDLPIDKQEFDYIVTALWKCRKSEDKCGDLYDKMKLVQEVMDANPGGPYKRILREEHNMVCLLYTSPSPRDGIGSRMPSSA